MIQAQSHPDRRSDSIAFLRLLLATVVIYSHASDLGKFPPDILGTLSGGRWNLGGLAVDGFFFISGLLITQSYMRLQSLPRFLWHRILRIFPGFWVCSIVTAFVFAPIVYTYEGGPWREFLTAYPDGPLRYIWVNALLRMHQFSIDGLLQYVPFPRAFNGSLWTLSSEFGCYLAIGVLGVLGLLKRSGSVVTAAFILLWLCNISDNIFGYAAQSVPFFSSIFAAHVYLDWVVYFFLGSVTYFYRDQIGFDWKLFAVAVIAIPVLMPSPYYGAVLPFALCYALYWLAYRLPVYKADRYGDFSYGIYVYAFPVQQLLAFFQLNRFGFWAYVIMSVAATLPLAIASWHFIEGPALRLKDVTLASLFAARNAHAKEGTPVA